MKQESISKSLGELSRPAHDDKVAGLPDSPPDCEAARRIVEAIWHRLPSPGFAVRLWTGELWSPTPPEQARFILCLRSPAAVRRMFANAGALSFGEAYAFGLVEVEGSMPEIFAPLERVMRLELR